MKSLFEKFSSRANLIQAWNYLNKSNPQSHGLDGETIEGFQKNLIQNIKQIQRQLRDGAYSFQLPRGHLIPKDNGKKRPLKIPAVRDRVVMHGILNVIRRFFKKYQHRCSYAYIEDRSRQDALREIIRLRDGGYWHVLESDIVNFFDKVNQELLTGVVYAELSDSTLNSLIKSSLNAEIGNKSRFPDKDLQYFPDGTVGLAQGGILSPLFSNVYLSRFDSAMVHEGFKMIRYADDFIVLCKDAGTAKNAYDFASSFLIQNLGLEIHNPDDKKTRITTFAEGFDFLGITFNHNSICPNEKARNRFRSKITELSSKKGFKNLAGTLNKLRLIILGWGHSYSFCHAENMKDGNPSMIATINSLEKTIGKTVEGILNRSELAPKGKLRGYHYRVMGIPSLKQVLDMPPLIQYQKRRRKNEQARIKSVLGLLPGSL